MENFTWIEPSYESVTERLPSSICNLNVLDWSLLEIAGAPS
jgi:hypothetical protein